MSVTPLATPPEGGDGSGLAVDEEMLIAYVVGELDPETHLRIERERQRIGSPVWKWFQEFDAKCADPFNVDWLKVANTPNESSEPE